MKLKDIFGFILVAFNVIVGLAPTSVWADIPTTERDALIALYNSTDGANWANRDLWRDGDDFSAVGTECSWNGVVCNTAGDAVVTIGLTLNNLSGSLPLQIGNFPSLRFFYLNGNYLIGGIPSTLGNLPNVLIIKLNNNQLSGSIPPELGNSPALEELYLHKNQLSGSIPPELGLIDTLVTLDLHSNQLTGSIPPQMGNIDSLGYLTLSDNQLSGSIPPEIGNLSFLRILEINSNQLSGSIPSELGNIGGYMNEIELGNNQLSGNIPGELGNLPNLGIVILKGNRLTGSIPPEFGNLDHMTTLDLSNNQLTGAIPADLGSASFPSYLYLNNNQLTGSIPPELGNMVGSYLFLHSNQLSGEIPSELGNIAVYTSTGLDLRWNALHTDDETLISSLNSKQVGGDWQSSQTIAPENVAILSAVDHTVWVNWDIVSYTTDTGGYDLYYKETPSSEWLSNGSAASKLTTSFPMIGLTPGTQYDFAMRTFTDIHPNNQNRVPSDLSMLVTGTTSSTGCAQPVVNISETPRWTLSVTQAFDSYLWSTGETTQSISVTPPEATSYWVTTTFGSCEESATAEVDPLIFGDGFEVGSTSAWSSVFP